MSGYTEGQQGRADTGRPKDFREWAEHEGLRVVKSVGDWGTPLTPWKAFPSLFCAGMIYVLEQPNDPVQEGEAPARKGEAATREGEAPAEPR